MPVLRFSEFEVEWELKKLGAIFKISAGGDIEGEHVSQIRDEKYKYPIYANAEKDKGFYGFSDTYKIEENVITVAGRGVNIGIAHARNHKFYPIVRLLVLVPKNSENIYFFEYQINRLNLIKESTGVPQLTAPQVSNYVVFYPPLPEQQKIASFLTSVDTRLTQLKQKKNLLEQYKKGVMQKIFSQEIRFLAVPTTISTGSTDADTVSQTDENMIIANESSDLRQSVTEPVEGTLQEFPEWEKKKLGEIVDFIKNGLSLNQNIEKEGYKVTRIETISDKSINIEKVGFVRTSQDITEYRLLIGDMLFSNINSVAHIGKIAYVDKDYDLYHGMNLLNIRINKEKSNPKFFYYQLTSRQLKKHFEEICNKAVNQASINQTDLKKTKLLFPFLAEQTKIANFLSSLDEKINQCSSQIEKTELWKKGLLQQMFV